MQCALWLCCHNDAPACPCPGVQVSCDSSPWLCPTWGGLPHSWIGGHTSPLSLAHRLQRLGHRCLATSGCSAAACSGSAASPAQNRSSELCGQHAVLRCGQQRCVHGLATPWLGGWMGVWHAACLVAATPNRVPLLRRPEIQECVRSSSLEGHAQYCDTDPRCVAFVYKAGKPGVRNWCWDGHRPARKLLE